MSYDKVLMYGGITLFGLFVINMVLLLSNLNSLDVLTSQQGIVFSVLFTMCQMILVYHSQLFIKQSVDKEGLQSNTEVMGK